MSRWLRQRRFPKAGLLSQFTLVGIVSSLLIAAASSWIIESHVKNLMLREIESRAIEHVSFGLPMNVRASDFQPPYSPETLDRIATRLDLMVRGVDPSSDGLLRIHLFSSDGTIVYSDNSALRGYQVSPSAEPGLAAALQGHTVSAISRLSSEKSQAIKAFHTDALEAFVPVRIDGQIVGAYEIYHSLDMIHSVRPLIWTLVSLGFLTLLVTLLFIVRNAAQRIQRHLAERELLVEQAARAQAEMAATQELEQMKDELTSVVSHELRTPLASIVGFIELMLYREYPPAQERQFLQLVHSEGLRLTSLINDFLDLQRLESRGASIHRKPIDMTTSIELAIAAAGDDAQRPVMLSLDDTLPTVHADPDRIQQVLGNLISNARKYSPDGGAITVHARQDGECLTVSVQDQGLGIPDTALPKLFQKFYRVDNSDHRDIKGTGLGLMICQRIVSAHGGTIWAESEGLRHGARFSFTLPLHQAFSPPPEHVDVLIIEDDPSFARLLETQLKDRQLSALTLGNAEAALQYLTSRMPRAIVLDLLLPDMSGMDFLKRISREIASPPPCVVTTMQDLSAHETRMLKEHGAGAILKKGPRAAMDASNHVLELVRLQESLMSATG
ncbi:MAG: ATP-binding protein [Chloroflexota bacterium]